MSRLTKQERALFKRLYDKADAYELANSADAPLVQPPKDMSLAAMKGNPSFKAQFDVKFLLKYFSVAAGVYTAVAAAALPAALKQNLSMFLFGNSDWAAGFARMKQAFPLTNWIYDAPFIYGGTSNPAINGVVIDSTVKNLLVNGDLVIPVYATSGGTNYVGLVILRCTQVAYATLLDSLSSDRFAINNIRYIVDTTTYTTVQFDNNIYVTKQSLFGKFESDFTSPNSFKKPEQFQAGIIDVPLEIGVDKQTGLATYIQYATVEFTWSIFVRSFDKLQA